MKLLLSLLALTLFFGSTAPAHAYRINVLDPYTTFDVTSQPFTAEFAACDPAEFPPGVSSGEFCFSGKNETGQTITTLELIVPDTGVFAGQNLDCSATSQSIFSASSCGVYNGYDVFFFSGLDIITHADVTNQNPNADSFLIIIDNLDLPPGTDPTDVTLPPAGASTPDALVIPPAAIPEPNSLVLLSTGLLIGGFFFARKRGLLPVPVNNSSR
jgi:hypothetical protein